MRSVLAGKQSEQSGTDVRGVGQTSAPVGTGARTWRTVYVQWHRQSRRTSTPHPHTDCLHPAAQKPSAAAGGRGLQLTTHLLTAHTASAQLKLRFSKQDAAAWEGENSRLGLPSEPLFIKNTLLSNQGNDELRQKSSVTLQIKSGEKTDP